MVQSSKRLAIINSVYATGSTGHIVKRIEQAAKAHDYSTCVLYSRMNTIEDDCVHRIYSPTSFYSHVALALSLDQHGLHSKTNTQKFIEILDEFKPTIINIHNLHGFYIHYPMLMQYLLEQNIPIVMTLHDCWTFTGFCAHYTAAGCQQWKDGCKHCKIHDVYPYRGLISNAKNNVQLKKRWFNHPNITMVTPSNWLKEQVEQSFITNPVEVIHNTIDSTIFNSKSKPKIVSTVRPIVLLVATNWTKNKGRDDLIRLYQLLSDHYQLVTVGNLKIKSIPWIHFQRLEPSDLAALYAQATVFVNLTYEDTYPTVNLEAIASQTPIISYAAGGSSELCHPSNRVEPGNIKKIAEMINTHTFDHTPLIIDNPPMENAYIALFDRLLANQISN